MEQNKSSDGTGMDQTSILESCETIFLHIVLHAIEED